MNTEIKDVIEKFKEVRDILKKLDNRDDAIEYLINETKLIDLKNTKKIIILVKRKSTV